MLPTLIYQRLSGLGPSALSEVAILSLLIFGPEVIYDLTIGIFVGVIIGTYSSIYVASALALRLGVSRADLLVPEKEGQPDQRP